MQAFQEPGGPQLIVCSTRVGAQGITLTRASNVAFLDLEWTPAIHDQAEDRCHRIGQEDAVTAWYLLAAETIDETMIELIAKKRGIVDAVTDGRRDESEALLQAVVRELRGKPRKRLRSVVFFLGVVGAGSQNAAARCCNRVVPRPNGRVPEPEQQAPVAASGEAAVLLWRRGADPGPRAR